MACQLVGAGARSRHDNAGEAETWLGALGEHGSSPVSDAPLLRFVQVSKRFGGTVAVNEVSLDLHAGEILALLGENGAGKSTLIKMLAGIHAPDEGQILVRGQHYQHRPAVAGERQTVAFIHQDLGLIDWMTVTENMAMGLGYPRRFGLIGWRQAERRARDALAAVGGAIDPDARVGGLTRTEKSLVAIARALAVEAAIIVLDEPTAGLDPRAVTTLRAALSNLEARGTTVVVSTHDIDFAWEWADEVGVVVDGIVHQGSTVKIMTDEALLGRAHLGVPWPVRLLRSLGHEIDVVAPPRTVSDVARLLG